MNPKVEVLRQRYAHILEDTSPMRAPVPVPGEDGAFTGDPREHFREIEELQNDNPLQNDEELLDILIENLHESVMAHGLEWK